MEASKLFDRYINYLSGLGDVLGLNIFNKTWKISWNYRLFVTFFWCIQYIMWLTHSIVNADGTKELLKSVGFAGLFLQNMVKLFVILRTDEQKQAILGVITLVLLLMKMTTVLYFSCLVIFSLYPGYMYFWEDTKVTIFPLLIPGINIHSLYGYSITNMLQLILALYGIVGMLASDSAFMMFVLHIVTYVELFRVECEKFEAELLASEWRERWHSNQYKAFCRRRMLVIYRFHQDIITYMDELKMCYHDVCVVALATCSFSMVLNLFLVLTTDWYATYGFLAVTFFQLLMCSVLGNVIQVMNDRLIEVMQNLPWYLLPIGEQKRFLFMLCRSQIPADMDVRGFGPLNMETFTAIMQKTFMMMYSFIEE